MKKLFLIFLIVLIFGISACKPVITPTNEVSTTNPADVPTETITPIQTNTPLSVPNITATPAITPPDYSAAVYLDDRSTPASLVYSFANAVNRNEFSREQTYFLNTIEEGSSAGDFSLQNGDVLSVMVLMGDIYSEGAAGSIYYTVPALFNWTLQDGTHPRSSACLLLRLVQPGFFSEPPIESMQIDRGTFTPIDDTVSEADVLANACMDTDYGNTVTGTTPVSQEMENLADLSQNNYIDNRSGAVEVISSMFNAINRREYVRAYSYWQDTITLGDYDDYAAGFADTDTIAVTFGQVTSDAGAGQWYYQIPVAQVVKTTNGETQTFVGCYTLHLSNPGMQASIPFWPLGITEGHFETVANGTDVTSLLETACN